MTREGEAVDSGIHTNPELAKRIEIFHKNVAYLEQNRDQLRQQYPGELVIIQNETVVAHTKLSGTPEGAYEQERVAWQEVEDAGFDRGSAHYEFFGNLADTVTP